MKLNKDEGAPIGPEMFLAFILSKSDRTSGPQQLDKKMKTKEKCPLENGWNSILREPSH